MIGMNKVTKYMKANVMSADTIIIVVGDMKIKVDSLKIRKIDHDDQYNATHASNKIISMQTIHTKIRPISSFVLVVVLVITLYRIFLPC